MSDALARLTAALADRYRIERELGQGGMATVYLAEDLKHKRKVALKVLKPELAAVLGAERFVQEITTTAALQHPHILPLFDSGESDGFLWYAMPFIDGETLRGKLDRETQLGIEESVRIATDVASALQYAHTHGVIHRDIKPENILLHDGRPMVADFGIALALSAAAGGRMTETGMSLGTPHYMSPEQATAEKEITGRSDIYSLGSVCYEMLAGEPPHTGGSAQQIVMKIIAEQPQPVTELRKSVPPNVAAAVGKALEKLPADRFESAKEFAEALANPAFRTMANSPGASHAAAPGRRVAVLAGIALVATLFAGWGWLRSPRTGAISPPWRVRMVLPDSASVEGRMSFSGDGAALVYSGGGRLWMRAADGADPVPIPGTEGGDGAAISPDGQRVIFRRTTRSSSDIVMLPLAGGTPRLVVPGVQLSGGFDWTDNEHIVYAGLGGLLRVPLADGQGEQLTAIDTAAGEVLHVGASALPDGQGVVFITTMRNPDSSYVSAVGPSGGAVTRLMPGREVTFAAPDHLIVKRADGSIVAVPFDPGRRRRTGDPVVIAAGLGGGSFSRLGMAAASSTGRLIYVSGGWVRSGDPADLVWVGRTGARSPLDSTWIGSFHGVALSSDGRRIAVNVYSDRAEELQVRDLSSGSVIPVVVQGTQIRSPVFSRDGRSLYFVGLGAIHGVLRVDPGGTAAAERVINPGFVYVGDLARSPDGAQLYYVKQGPERSRQIVRSTLADTSTQIIVATSGGVSAIRPQISPDGRWLAFLMVSSTGAELHVRATDMAHTEEWTVASSVNGGSSIRWSTAGDQLYFRSGDSMMTVPVRAGPSFSAGPPAVLFRVDGLQSAFDLGPDGRFLMIRTRQDLRPPTELMMLERWTELLPR